MNQLKYYLNLILKGVFSKKIIVIDTHFQVVMLCHKKNINDVKLQ